jgi:hypothetical protein
MTSEDFGNFIPNQTGGFTGSIANSDCVIAPGHYPGTWSVKVGKKRIVTATDDIDHAWRQARSFANSLKDANSVPDA